VITVPLDQGNELVFFGACAELCTATVALAAPRAGTEVPVAG
jgi:hypothetical protein